MKENGVIQEYTGSLSRQIREEYHIGEEYYHGEIKRGLRNSDGTGVMVASPGGLGGLSAARTASASPSPEGFTTGASSLMTLWRPTGRREPSGSRRWRICC